MSADEASVNQPMRLALEQSIAQAEKHAELNALIGFDAAAARQRAALAVAASPATSTSSRFAGVPLVVKDNIAVAGMPLTGGCPAFAGYVPSTTASAVQKLLDCGAYVLAKANLHELAFGITSANQAYGPVLNPFDHQHLAGGSSGGCAVAVATGISPIALGNDTGGSIRIPAALCGVFGFRPSTGRYPTDGVLTLSPTRDAIGTMARTLDELIALDQVLASEASNSSIDTNPKRIAIPVQPFWSDLSPEMSVACEAALHSLRRAGFETIDVDASEIARIDEAIGFVIAVHETWIEWQRTVPERLGISVQAMTGQIASDDVRSLFEMMASDQCPPASAYVGALAQRAELQAAYRRLLRDANAATLLMPTTVRAAMRRDETETCWLNGTQRPTFPTFVRQTSPASVAGCPSLSLPGGLLASGLPFGLLLEALPGQDLALLSIARQVEAALKEWVP
jgi:indoleacetamide hydrolase